MMGLGGVLPVAPRRISGLCRKIVASCLVAAFTALLPAGLAAEETILAPRVSGSPAAVLRGLDKTAGDFTDIELEVGHTARLGRLMVTLGDCRYPTENPAGDAYAYVVVRDVEAQMPSFAGWMIASAPALNALENARYDLWVMRCKI
ncbi:DUF2155 domain-containing protein [Profundibacterium mesophilum]|uniref:DUF2155 domain-containing protein n=1 Tax=Profundibacterium mesophilum KAUST100406-0324 TaxID=1037889 RepID=A0A921NWT8_9RHOB|nr:DUF2155 domain-containing protein [Profundibacterium mesophilum]KAF0674993.1 uncharacterized protein PMES_02702 [Profundibacterium mesophilum KAUST100406-0324]